MTPTRSPHYRVGFVGTGAISEFHARAVHRTPLATLAAVFDPDHARAEAFASRWKRPAVCRSLDELWHMNLDVVHVLAPAAVHGVLTLAALEHGCHAYVEKPLAITPTDSARVIAVAEERARLVGVGHSLLFDPTVRRLARIVESGRLGEVVGVHYSRSQPVPVAPSGDPSPFHVDAGFPFWDAGVHGVYLIESLIGGIRDVRVHVGSIARNPQVLCDEWHVLLTCDRGTGGIHLSYVVQPWQSLLVVSGSRGTARADLFAGTVAVRRARRLPSLAARLVNSSSESAALLAQTARTGLCAATGRLRQFHGVQEAVAEFYAALTAGRAPAVTAARAQSTVEWTDRIAAEGEKAARGVLSHFSTTPRAKILVTGASGRLGRHLVARLLKEGRRVRVLVRTVPPEEWRHDDRIEPVFGDLGDAAAVDRAVDGTEIVFHLGATMGGTAAEFDRGTVSGTRHVVQSSLVRNVQRLVYVSSLSVLRAVDPEADAIDEASPLEPAAERRGLYTRSKLLAEQLVTKAVHTDGLPAIILRPAEIVGPEGPRLSSAMAIRVAGLLLVFGNGHMALPFVAAEDVADALILAADRGPFDGCIVHIVDPYSVTQDDVVRWHAANGSPWRRVVHIPAPAATAAARLVELAGAALRVPSPVTRYQIMSALAAKRFVSSRATDVLGWAPRYGVARAFAAAVRDERAISAATGTVITS